MGRRFGEQQLADGGNKTHGIEQGQREQTSKVRQHSKQQEYHPCHVHRLEHQNLVRNILQ